MRNGYIHVVYKSYCNRQSLFQPHDDLSKLYSTIDMKIVSLLKLRKKKDKSVHKHVATSAVFLYARLQTPHRRDVLWYGDVRPSGSPSLLLRTSVFHTVLLHAWNWRIELKLCIWLCFNVLQVWVSSICFNFCRSYAPFGT